MDILYGRNPVLESLRAGRRKVRGLFLADSAKEGSVLTEIVRRVHQIGGTHEQLSKHELARLVGHRQHQGVALETGSYPYAEVEDMLSRAEEAGESPFLLILDLMQDPQNVGVLLRTAEAVGVHGVLLQKRRGVGISPAVVNASSGAVEHLLVSREINLVRAMRNLQELNLWLWGLEMSPEAESYYQVDLSGSIALVVGGEGAGLRRLVRKTCDRLVRLPMRGRVESLNASAAGSVALYEIWRAREFN